MEPLGIIGGSAFLTGDAPPDTTERSISTDRGDVTVFEGPGFIFLRRHGQGRYHPPHRIPHHAHALALKAAGVRRAVSLCSVGSLDIGIRPGSVVIPDDYLSLHPPPTFAQDERLHIVPVLDPELRTALVDLARDVAERTEGWTEASPGGTARSDIRDGGVYAQTHGPRFETRAEIRMLSDYADVVGMTGASEATLLQERGIASAILGIVDNHAHGLGTRPLSLEAFDRQLEENAARAAALLDAIIDWAGGRDA